MNLWQRYFVKETLKLFFLFIFCFYALYTLIDFSIHSRQYNYHGSYHWKEIFTYYAFEFVRRLDVLVPFAILLATIKTILKLNLHRELMAFMASGIAIKTLLRPFLLLSLAFVAILYVNEEFVLPKALQEIKKIDSLHHYQKKAKGVPAVQHLILEDNSTLLFQSYDPQKGSFFDVYWIRKIDDIYKFKYLYPYTEIPVGTFVDHFVRNTEGNMVHLDSHEIRLFPEIKFNSTKLLETLSSPEEFSLSELYRKMPNFSDPTNEKQAKISSMFTYKMIIPWLSFLVILGACPFCVIYSRDNPSLLIYSVTIFSLVFIYLILDAALILGERQVLSPLIALGAPFVFFFALLSLRYRRLN